MFRVKKVPTMRMVMVRRSMRSPVSLMFVFHYLDDVADGVGEADVVMVTSVVPSPSWTRRPSINHATKVTNIAQNLQLQNHATNHATSHERATTTV